MKRGVGGNEKNSRHILFFLPRVFFNRLLVFFLIDCWSLFFVIVVAKTPPHEYTHARTHTHKSPPPRVEGCQAELTKKKYFRDFIVFFFFRYSFFSPPAHPSFFVRRRF